MTITRDNFHVFDTNNDKKITKDELTAQLQNIGVPQSGINDIIARFTAVSGGDNELSLTDLPEPPETFAAFQTRMDNTPMNPTQVVSAFENHMTRNNITLTSGSDAFNAMKGLRSAATDSSYDRNAFFDNLQVMEDYFELLQTPPATP